MSNMSGGSAGLARIPASPSARASPSAAAAAAAGGFENKGDTAGERFRWARREEEL